MNNDKLDYHSQFVAFVQDFKATDDQTVVVTFKQPSPRFAFEVLTFKFDTGIGIVPEHVLSKQADVNAFAGGLDMPHSGPYTCVIWDQNQKIFDLRDGLVGGQSGHCPGSGRQARRHDQHRRSGRPEHGYGRPARREQRV